jgi:hypothetical protein
MRRSKIDTIFSQMTSFDETKFKDIESILFQIDLISQKKRYFQKNLQKRKLLN